MAPPWSMGGIAPPRQQLVVERIGLLGAERGSGGGGRMGSVCLALEDEILKHLENKLKGDPSSLTLSEPEIQELLGTVHYTKTILAPFDETQERGPQFQHCLLEIQKSLALLHFLLQPDQRQAKKDGKKALISFNAKRIRIFQTDFSLRFKLDHLSAMFSPGKAGKSLIEDPEGKEWWDRSFGNKVCKWDSYSSANIYNLCFN